MQFTVYCILSSKINKIPYATLILNLKHSEPYLGCMGTSSLFYKRNNFCDFLGHKALPKWDVLIKESARGGGGGGGGRGGGGQILSFTSGPH